MNASAGTHAGRSRATVSSVKPARTTTRDVVDAIASRGGTTALSSLRDWRGLGMWLRYSGLLFAFVAAGAAALADGDNRGVSAAQSCRNLATELTAQTTAPGGFVADMKTSCSFNAPAKQSTCTVQYSDRRGTSMTTTTITTYNSVADVVDEIAVNPPLSYALTAKVSQTSGRGTPGSGVTNTFGDNRRILKTVNSSVGGESTTTYSEWDQADRPTRANDVGKGFNNTRIISYDN